MSLSVVWSNEQEEHEINSDLIALLEIILQKAGEAEGIDEGKWILPSLITNASMS